MLDPALCARPTSQWLGMKSLISNWLMTPTLVILPLVALILIPWLITRLRWKRQLSGLGTILLVAYFIATFPLTVAVANKGLVAFVPNDPGITADAIVILGRGESLRESRVEVAADLWKAQRAPQIFASGRGDGEKIVEMLRADGIPATALDQESCSQTTEENALFTASMLKPQGIKRILLVTDPPHMLRSLLTFRAQGFRAFPHPSPLPTNLAGNRKALIVFYEYAGLVSYGLKGYIAPASVAAETSWEQGEQGEQG